MSAFWIEKKLENDETRGRRADAEELKHFLTFSVDFSSTRVMHWCGIEIILWDES